MAEAAKIKENIQEASMEITNDESNTSVEIAQIHKTTVEETKSFGIGEKNVGISNEKTSEDANDVITPCIGTDELTTLQSQSNKMDVGKDTQSVDETQETQEKQNGEQETGGDNTLTKVISEEETITEARSIEETNPQAKTIEPSITDAVPVTMDTQESKENECHDSNVNTNESSTNQEKQPDLKPLGSLGLLNQYSSSSDEDEDSSSDDDDDESDSESESESEPDVPSNKEATEIPSPNDTELNTIANDILNSVMSRENYRNVPSDTSESDDSDVECLGTLPAQTIDITNDEEIQEFLDSCEENAPPGPIKAIGELGIEDLPPIAELTITVAESECKELGKISGIVDTLVLVESLPGFAAVDIDTVLFLEKGNRTLGQVFDVMGNVASPIYCVRFNSAQDILAKNISVGSTVYVAPQTEYTNFIVLSDLMKERGCDASWENDHEAPEGYNDFSDDEEERLMRKQQSQKQRNRNRPTEASDQRPNKVTVKSEPNTPNGRGGRRQKPWTNNRSAEKPPTRFYKDNRGYANANLNGGPHYQHHRMPPVHQNYSWHTATMHGMPAASTSTQPMPYPPYGAPNHGIPPNMYPNPFAMQANQMTNYGPFNLHAFPPLPPPMSPSQQPQHHLQQPPPPPMNTQYKRRNPNSFQ